MTSVPKKSLSLIVAGLCMLAGATALIAAEPAKPAAAPSAKPAVPPSEKVTIIIQTVPPKKAAVMWGRKNLGIIPTPRPLIVERPRDSGPMDLVIRATGYLPVHTRATTFSDMRLAVKLTPVDQKNTLFGYRNEPPPPSPDGGVPSAPLPAPQAPSPAPPLPPAPQP